MSTPPAHLAVLLGGPRDGDLICVADPAPAVHRIELPDPYPDGADPLPIADDGRYLDAGWRTHEWHLVADWDPGSDARAGQRSPTVAYRYVDPAV